MTPSPTDEDIHAAIDAAGIHWSAQPVRRAIAGGKPSDIARSIWAHACVLARLRTTQEDIEHLRSQARDFKSSALEHREAVSRLFPALAILERWARGIWLEGRVPQADLDELTPLLAKAREALLQTPGAGKMALEMRAQLYHPAISGRIEHGD